VALSEHEQRLLDEMERHLYQNDADFVAPGGKGSMPNYTAVTFGVIIALLGLGAVIGGIAARLPVLGIAGFAIMFVGVLLMTRRVPVDQEPTSMGGAKPARPARGGFMSAFEQRWDRRMDERDDGR